MVKPFITFSIERQRGSDCAVVSIWRVTDDGHRLHRERLEEYETLSKGATESARKSMRKFAA